MVTTAQIKRGLANFIDGEIMNKIPGGTVKKTLVGTFMGMYLHNIDKMVSNAHTSPFIVALGIIDVDGNIDIDTLMEEVKKNIPDTGLKIDIDVFGFHLGDMKLQRQDMESLRAHILRA